MNKEAEDHLVSVAVTLFLRHGRTFRSHLDQAADLWSGPLFDQSVLLCPGAFEKYTLNYLESVMANLKDVSPHPLFNRDFFEGVCRSLGIMAKRASTRLIFRLRDGLEEFLRTDEHGFDIAVNRDANGLKTSSTMPLFSLPYEGNLDSFLAGAIAASRIVRIDDGNLMLSLSRMCESELKRMRVLYEPWGKTLVISPFYFMLYCGDLPLQIYSEMMNEIGNASIPEKARASLDAVFHWRILNRTSPFSRGMLPFLLNRTGYRNRFGFSFGDIEQKMRTKRFDFVDKRIRQRCMRWYNIYVEHRTSK